MKKALTLILILSLFSILWTNCSKSKVQSSGKTPMVVIDDSITIYKEDIMNKFKNIKAFYALITRKKMTPKDSIALLKNVIDADILFNILRVEAEKDTSLHITDSMVNAEVNKFILQHFKGDTTAFKNYLTKTKTTFEEFRSSIKTNLLVNKYVEKLKNEVKIDSNVVKNYYNKHKNEYKMYHVSHILVLKKKPDSTNIDSALIKIKNIQKMLKKDGSNFSEIAQKYSEGPSKVKGGDIGYVKLKDLDRNFAKALDTMKVGEISDIVKTIYGYHIIFLHDIKDSLDNKTYALISKRLKDQNINAIYDKIKKRHKIDIKIKIN